MAAIIENNGITVAYAEIKSNAVETIQQFTHYDLYEPYLLKRGSEKRRLEFANAILLLSEALHQEPLIGYTENGKPFLPDQNRNISISHSKDCIAVAASEKYHVGIDIEIVRTRVLELAERFMTPQEYALFNDIQNKRSVLGYSAEEYATMVWCGKEAIYKIAGHDATDFVTGQEIFITPAHCYGVMTKSDQQYELKIIDGPADHIIILAHD